MIETQLDLTGIDLPLVLHPGGPVSDDDLMRFSARNKPFKIEQNKEGDITIMTPVGGIGGTHELYVTSALFAWAEHDASGIAFGPNTGFRLADGSCLSPDAAWLALPRWNALTPGQQIGYPPLCPDFLIEIRSRTDPRRLLEAKMQLWLENGARLAWLIDPIDASSTIYRPGQPPESLFRPEVLRADNPVHGFELRTTRLWPIIP